MKIQHSARTLVYHRGHLSYPELIHIWQKKSVVKQKAKNLQNAKTLAWAQKVLLAPLSDTSCQQRSLVLANQ